MDEKIFCRNIKYLREQNKLSKREMCRRLKISVKTLEKLEAGNMPPRLSCDILFEIQGCFGVEPKNMFKDLSR